MLHKGCLLPTVSTAMRGARRIRVAPEMLHRLCWRIAASLEVADGARDETVIIAARDLLGEYDEALTVQTAARKLVHLIGDARRDDLADPEIAGLHLFIASLAAKLDIDHDHILRLTDGGSAAPLAAILAARGIALEPAMAIIYLLKGFSLTPQDISVFERGYEKLSKAVARAEIARWSADRAAMLAESAKP